MLENAVAESRPNRGKNEEDEVAGILSGGLLPK